METTSILAQSVRDRIQAHVEQNEPFTCDQIAQELDNLDVADIDVALVEIQEIITNCYLELVIPYGWARTAVDIGDSRPVIYHPCDQSIQGYVSKMFPTPVKTRCRSVTISGKVGHQLGDTRYITDNTYGKIRVPKKFLDILGVRPGDSVIYSVYPDVKKIILTRDDLAHQNAHKGQSNSLRITSSWGVFLSLRKTFKIQWCKAIRFTQLSKDVVGGVMLEE